MDWDFCFDKSEEQSMKRKWLWTGAGAAALGLALFFPMAAQAAAVPDGIYVDGQNLGGLEAEEAGEQIAAYVEKMAGQTVTLEVAGNQVSTTAAELGFHWENTDAVEETMEEYVTGNVVSRYLKQKELEQTRTMDGRPNAAGTGILERKGDQKQPANRDGRGTANGLNRQEQQRNGQPEGGHPGDRVAGRKPHQTGAKNRKKRQPYTPAADDG